MARDIASTKMRTSAALELRMLGHTYDDIADVLGYASKSGAHNAIKRAVTSRLDRNIEKYRIDALARLDLMQAILWPKVQLGDAQAVKIVSKLIDQRLQVLGQCDQKPFASIPTSKPKKVSEFSNPHPLRLL